MESEQLFNRKGYYRNSYNSIASASSDEELLDGTGVVMDFHTSEDDNLLDGDATSPAQLGLRQSSPLATNQPTKLAARRAIDRLSSDDITGSLAVSCCSGEGG
ncbi:unnamed protein product [Coregonus sp. 'balchen']|nr:unnamed protein product [Coregonus sp. 'balchen']